MQATPQRARSTLLTVLLLWFALYASFTLFTPPLLDDADSVHAEVAREMLLRHDWVTLYANGVRYLEKAPLLYWSMAASVKLAGLFGANSPRALAAAARVPLALSMLTLALLCEAFAGRMFACARAGLYAALIVLSSFGMFIFTRITIPDAMVCLWLTAAMYCFWRTEEQDSTNGVSSDPVGSRAARIPFLGRGQHGSLWSLGFAAACALNVLTKGLIGVVFPIGTVLAYLLLTRGLRGTLTHLRTLHPFASAVVFLLIAAPWHVLAGLANPTQGHPEPFRFMHGHWQVPLPTDGNVRGWFWFYFMNEHVLRYLNLRVPHDYDTAPLWLFWGLCLVWMMPWSAFVFHATWGPLKEWYAALRVRLSATEARQPFSTEELQNRPFLLVVWAAFVLLFFSLSTRQEYYVLPALPALSMLVAGWLAQGTDGLLSPASAAQKTARIGPRITAVLLVFGALFAVASFWFLVHTRAPAPDTDLAQLLQQNPGDYALSMGHFLDLNAQALGLFRLPLALAAISLFLGPLAALLLRRFQREHAANLALAAGAFGFLLAAHLGLRTFAPVITSAQLAETIAPQVHAQDLLCIHGEYESGSTLGFYLRRNDLHILEGRSSNLWYGSFFPDAPHIFETPESLAAKWGGPQRIFLWQSLTDEPRNLPPLSGPVYVIARSGGKEIVSNRASD